MHTSPHLPITLAICGVCQHLGHYYETLGGDRLEFSGTIDFYPKAGSERAVGTLKFKCFHESGCAAVRGFENRSVMTYLGGGVSPLGTVTEGIGNNGDGYEGIKWKLFWNIQPRSRTAK